MIVQHNKKDHKEDILSSKIRNCICFWYYEKNRFSHDMAGMELIRN